MQVYMFEWSIVSCLHFDSDGVHILFQQIRETRRQVQDSVSGIQKMSVGHQIGDKSHTIGKSYNSKTNEEMETHDFVNMDEGMCCVMSCFMQQW